MNLLSLFETATELTRAGEPFVVVTMLGTRGHAPQDPGAKAIVTARGLHGGTVGGGKVEARAIAHAQAALAQSTAPAPERVTWNLQRDIGMSCGGEVEFLFEVHRPHVWPIVVYGAGHVSQALVRLLLTLECSVLCIDPRPEWLDRLPPESAKLRKRTEVAAAPDDAYHVVMTQGHTTDLPILAALLKRAAPPYVGVLGSDVKAAKIRKELLELGIEPARVEALRTPMGLPFGSNDPAEIAVSVTAQLLATRDELAERAANATRPQR